MKGDISKILAERGAAYGPFDGLAETHQGLQDVLTGNPGWNRLPPAVRESISMITGKIARAVNGDWRHADNPDDVIGYAMLWREFLGKQNAD